MVDTNLLVYAAVRQCPGHKQALRLLLKWRSEAELWFATWPILYEFLRVTTHPAIFPDPLSFQQAWRFLEALFASPSFGLLIETDRHADTVRQLTTEYPQVSGNRMHDLHIAALMREHGITDIRTADTDFHQFKFLRVLNPLGSP